MFVVCAVMDYVQRYAQPDDVRRIEHGGQGNGSGGTGRGSDENGAKEDSEDDDFLASSDEEEETAGKTDL